MFIPKKKLLFLGADFPKFELVFDDHELLLQNFRGSRVMRDVCPDVAFLSPRRLVRSVVCCSWCLKRYFASYKIPNSTQ